MAAVISLLGPPRIVRDGTPVPVRGHKPWAILALLVLRRQQPPRSQLAELLFADADDPLGTLRWNIAQLRRALGEGAVLTGDPLRLAWPPEFTIDVFDVQAARKPGTGLPYAELPGPLLDGLRFDGCPAFETWLAGERRRLAATCEALAREEALAALAGRRPEEAVTLARQLVVADPLDEAHQMLLVQALAESGDLAAASQQVAECTALFHRELGVAPSAQIRLAASARPSRSPIDSGRPTVTAQLEAGQAAIAAGAADAGIDSLRRAAADALSCGAGDLYVESGVALGSALIHTVRGRDEEAAAVLHRAIAAEDAPGVAAELRARARRKLATVDLMSGRRDRAEAWFAAAEDIAGPDDLDERSSIAGWRGFNLSDMGRYADALAQFALSIDLARRCGNARQEAWSLAGIGRVRLVRGELADAAVAFDRSLEICRAERWTAFLPYPEGLRAEIDRRAGDLGVAKESFRHAYALGVQVGDPCWQGIAGRGLGLIAVAEHDPSAAEEWLGAANSCTTAIAETNRWVQAFVCEGRCAAWIASGDVDRARAEAEALLRLATRAAMPEVVVRAQLYLHRLGRPGALAAARLAAADLDNPELEAELRSESSPAMVGARPR